MNIKITINLYKKKNPVLSKFSRSIISKKNFYLIYVSK